MNKILLDYINVIKTPKWERKEFNRLLHEWNDQKINELPTYEELVEFEKLCKTKGYSYNNHFFNQKIFSPIYYNEIFLKRNLEALKRVYNSNSSNLFPVPETNEFIDLLQIGLEIDSKNEIFLQDKYNRYIGSFELYIHEVPWIVIYSQNSASREEIELLLNKLEDFKLFCSNNNFSIPELKIKKYEFYFNTWKTYLKDFVQKMDYETYLSKHKLSEWIKIMKTEPDNYNYLLKKYNN